MEHEIRINERPIGRGNKTYIIAEMSANHRQDFDYAVETLHAIAESGADAVKVQTYTPNTLTLQCKNEHFQIKGGTLWDGRTLYSLYEEAYMPWDWQPELKEIATRLKLDFFSTPFDESSVEFLESIDVPAYKIASFELVDIPLIRRVAATGKDAILSTGMATLSEIDEAVRSFRAAGKGRLALLKCTSAYPAPAHAMNLRTIPNLAQTFSVVAGLSDHTMGIAVPVAAVALGAAIIEKHITLSRNVPGPDSAFSLEPAEFKQMVEAIRVAEAAIGEVTYEASVNEQSSRRFRRSLFVTADVKAGEPFTKENVRSIRPDSGLHTRHYGEIIGRKACCDIEKGTPLEWAMVAGG